MKFKVLQEDFSKCLSVALRFSSSKVQLPILANVLLKTEKGKLTIKATNLETSISISLGVKIEKDGEITVPAKVLSDIVSNLGVGQIDIESDREKLKITAQGFKSVIAGINSSDFPKVIDSISGEFNEVSSASLSGVLSDTLFSVSSDETRPVLTGVLVLLGKNSITCVGTDGFRLSQKKLEISGIEEETRLILPKNAVSEVIRLSGNSEVVKFIYKKTEKLAVFSFDNTILTTRVIEGEFPDFERIIPKKPDVAVRVDREDIGSAVRLAGVFAKDAANVIKVSFLKDALLIKAESNKSGIQETKIDAQIDGQYGDKYEIAFNYRFLEDFLNTVLGQEVLIKMSDPNSPVLFLDPSKNNFLHIIMPVRLQS